MAKKLRQFLPDVNDEFFDDLINFRIIPARPISWHNGKNNCARFLKHFGYTDAMANRIFCCVQGGRPLGRIKISSDAGQKADTAQGIEAILKEYPFDASSVRLNKLSAPDCRLKSRLQASRSHLNGIITASTAGASSCLD